MIGILSDYYADSTRKTTGQQKTETLGFNGGSHHKDPKGVYQIPCAVMCRASNEELKPLKIGARHVTRKTILSCSNGIFSRASWINKKPIPERLRCWKHNGRHEFPSAALHVAMSMSPSHPLHPECQRGGPHWCKVTTATAGAQTSGQHRHGLSKRRVPKCQRRWKNMAGHMR